MHPLLVRPRQSLNDMQESMQLLPIKKSTKSLKYFQAHAVQNPIKVIGFDLFLHPSKSKIKMGRPLIKVTNCRVLKEQDRDDVHIFLNKHSQNANSLRKFQIPNNFYAACKQTCLDITD